MARSSGSSSSRRSSGQGEVRDPENDRRLKENRGRSSRSSRDEDDYDDRSASSTRPSSRYDDEEHDRDESGRFVRGGHQPNDDGRGRVRALEHDGRVNRGRSSSRYEERSSRR
jgi:hypothetical protein